MPKPSPEEVKRREQKADEFNDELETLYEKFTPEQKEALGEVLDLIEEYVWPVTYDPLMRRLRWLRGEPKYQYRRHWENKQVDTNLVAWDLGDL